MKKGFIILIFISMLLVLFFSGCIGNESPVAVSILKEDGFTNQALYFHSSLSSDSDGNIVSYTWDFGDGASKTLDKQGLFHKYERPGNYKVNLTVVDEEGSSHSTSSFVNILSSTDDDENGVPDDWGNAPNFILNTLEDETYRLSDFFGKVVILDLMGVDCIYCVYMMPVLKAISENYSRFDLAIMSIDVYPYETEEYLQSFVDWFYTEYDMDLDWIFGMDSDGSISNNYVKGGGVPKLAIIDQNGNIYYSFTGYTEYSVIASKLDEII